MLEKREGDQYHGQCHLSKQTLAALPQAGINANEQMDKPPERSGHVEWSHLTSAAPNMPCRPSPQAQDAGDQSGRAPDPTSTLKARLPSTRVA